MHDIYMELGDWFLNAHGSNTPDWIASQLKDEKLFNSGKKKKINVEVFWIPHFVLSWYPRSDNG